MDVTITKSGTQHPKARPIARCRPDRVRGMPIFRDKRPLAAEMPSARLHENEKPCFLRLRTMRLSLRWQLSNVMATSPLITDYACKGNNRQGNLNSVQSVRCARAANY